MMQTPNGYRIRVRQIRGNGTPWIVRTYKRSFLFSRRISSDWFLDRKQAEAFAESLKAELANGPGLIKTRKPGWTLRRPTR